MGVDPVDRLEDRVLFRDASELGTPGGARPPTEVMVAFIEEHRECYGVEPICRELPIAPSTFYEQLARKAGPGRRPARARRDERLRGEIRRVHAADRGVYGVPKVWRQLSREGERLADAGIQPSVGSRGDSYDNALAESVIGLYKTKVIRRQGPWKGLESVEFATLDWVHWYNTQRLLEPIGWVPPAEHEMNYYLASQAVSETVGLN